MPKGAILIAHAEPSVRQRMYSCLAQAGYAVTELSLNRNLKTDLKDTAYDLLIADDQLPQMDGVALLHYFRQESISAPVILVATQPDVHRAVKAVQMGAGDYLAEPVDDQLLIKSVIRTIARSLDDQTRVKQPNEAARTIVTCTNEMQSLLDTATRIAPAAATVTIQGESGTGKELLARYIHDRSNRQTGAFVVSGIYPR